MWKNPDPWTSCCRSSELWTAFGLRKVIKRYVHYICICVFMQSLREGMSTKLVNGKIEPKGIKELRVYEKAVLKLVSNPHYVQERETSQFYKTILKASNGYRRLDCKLETYPWISFACGIEETNSLSQVSQTGNFPLHLFLCTKSFEITFLSILSPKLFGSWSTCTGTWITESTHQFHGKGTLLFNLSIPSYQWLNSVNLFIDLQNHALDQFV